MIVTPAMQKLLYASQILSTLKAGEGEPGGQLGSLGSSGQADPELVAYWDEEDIIVPRGDKVTRAMA